MKQKTDPHALPLKSYASEIERCSSVIEGVTVMERLLEAVRDATQRQRLASNIGHFADWLGEVRSRQAMDAATHARALTVVEALAAASSVPPDAPHMTRLRADLDDMRDRNG